MTTESLLLVYDVTVVLCVVYLYAQWRSEPMELEEAKFDLRRK